MFVLLPKPTLFEMTESSTTITFIVTEECQLRCKYCYLVGKNNTNKMSLLVAKHAIDYIFSDPNLCSFDKVIWDFIGGEPLLEIDLIEDIVNYAIETAKKYKHPWKSDYEIRITTNGLLYSSQKVQQFIKRFHNNLSISISIDGNKEKTDASRIFPNGKGSYTSIIKHIKLWREQFPEEGTKMTISHEDLPFVADSVKHLISLNIYTIDINPVLEDVWEPNDEVILENELIKSADYIIDNELFDKVNLTCFNESLGELSTENSSFVYGACGNFSLSIDFAGNFYPCLRFAKFSLRSKKPRTIGNIKDGIKWNLLRPLRSYCTQITSDKCLKCEIRNGCKSCPAENYDSSETGTIFQQQFSFCKMHKAKVRAKNYYFNKLYNKLNSLY